MQTITPGTDSLFVTENSDTEEGLEATSSQGVEVIELPKMKAFKSIDKIIEELKAKVDFPITFSDQEIALAKEFFNSHNYFSFSIYRKLLPRIEGVQYTFTDCINLYNFNTFLRENLTKFTGEIELMLRATLIEHVGAFYELRKQEHKADTITQGSNYQEELYKYDTGELYLDYAVYRRDKPEKVTEATEIIDKFKSIIDESKSDAIKHYRKKGTGIPLWVLIEEVTYGDVYHFAQALDTDFLHHWIDKAYDKSLRKFILGWFRCINFIRNDCAHYNRLYGRYFTVSPPRLLKEDIKKAEIKADNNATLFAHMLAIKNLLAYHVSAIQEWDYFIEVLSNEINANKDIVRIERMGFPSNWEECLHSQGYNDQLEIAKLSSVSNVKMSYK